MTRWSAAGVRVVARLKELLTGKRIAIAPGATDAWVARLIEEAGFPLVYMTGAGVANTLLGEPDIGLVTMSEMVAQASRIAHAVSVPVLADADTGFGGVANVARTVREYERAGIEGLHIEDQAFPKKCGHFEGKVLVEPAEMILRLEAALAARTDPNFVIIARCDARAVEGLDAAIERARLYARTGVDALFVEAPQSIEEVRRIPEALPDIPLIANMVEGGKTPLVSAAELERLGYRIVLYANFALRVAAYAVRDALATLRDTGTSAGMLDSILSWKDRQALVRLPEANAFEQDVVKRAASHHLADSDRR
ncbi:carboxyvinyl-carboxyphosphonate phosphorylmutase [bacterium]|nr:MAG: carboxyvinyl-carboxyphosphonate phosphorylmutase [bacterium]